MKKFKQIFVAIFLLTASQTQMFAQSNLENKIKQISEVTKIEELKDSANFKEKVLVYFTQPVDHKNANAGSFKQRVIVAHVGFDRPTVIITEGYGGVYALRPKYREEISRLFNTNMIFVEHRYFLESTPANVDWNYLTAENSACDLHAIFTQFKKIYPQKWISTGISKGGQTTMIYRTFFPNDVDISVPYVGPLCFGVEDGRHEPFLRKVSTAENRKKIQDFQIEVLKRRNKIMPMFEELCKNHKLTFSAPINEIYDFCVLEYPFAFWQWGSDVNKIPTAKASDEEIFSYLTKISGPDYFGNKQNSSFFVQAAKELGYYGYDTNPLKKYLTIKSSKGYLHRLMLPDNAKNITFDKTLSKKIKKYFKKNDPKMIFIYGETDPWTAAGVTWINFNKKKNMKIFIQPNGSHRTRISTMPTEMKDKIISIITEWLKE